jgi:hypothetical protein
MVLFAHARGCRTHKNIKAFENMTSSNMVYFGTIVTNQDFAASDELLLAILKAFILQPLNK